MWHLSRQASVGVLVIAGFILFAASAQAQHRHGHQHHGQHHHNYQRDHHHHHSSHWHSNGIRANYYQPSFGYHQPYPVYPQRAYYADPYCHDAIPLQSGYYPQTFGVGIQSGGFSLFLGR